MLTGANDTVFIIDGRADQRHDDLPREAVPPDGLELQLRRAGRRDRDARGCRAQNEVRLRRAYAQAIGILLAASVLHVAQDDAVAAIARKLRPQVGVGVVGHEALGGIGRVIVTGHLRPGVINEAHPRIERRPEPARVDFGHDLLARATIEAERIEVSLALDLASDHDRERDRPRLIGRIIRPALRGLGKRCIAASGACQQTPGHGGRVLDRDAVDEVLAAAEDGVADLQDIDTILWRSVQHHRVGLQKVVVAEGDLAAAGVVERQRRLEPAGDGVAEAGGAESVLWLRNEAVQSRPEAEPLSLQLADDEPSKCSVTARFVNSGTIHWNGTCRAEVQASATEAPLSSGLETETPLLLPLGTGTYSGVLDFSEVEAGNYILRTVLAYANQEATQQLPIVVTVGADGTRTVTVQGEAGGAQ